MTQIMLPLQIDVQREVQGVEMGVLRNGAAFLTERGLASMCGVQHTSVARAVEAYERGERSNKFSEVMKDHGLEPKLYLWTQRNGVDMKAYTEDACVAIVEYFAYYTDTPRQQARQSLRLLAKQTLRQFIYLAVGYVPATLDQSFANFHERLLLNTAPAGYFSVFKHTADLALAAIQMGLPNDARTVPDISIGQGWAKEWDASNGDDRYGPRKKHEHQYPSWYPQAAAPMLEAWVYPHAALPAFLDWFQQVYIPSKLPGYLATKVRQGQLTAPDALRLADAASSRQDLAATAAPKGMR